MLKHNSSCDFAIVPQNDYWNQVLQQSIVLIHRDSVSPRIVNSFIFFLSELSLGQRDQDSGKKLIIKLGPAHVLLINIIILKIVKFSENYALY